MVFAARSEVTSGHRLAHLVQLLDEGPWTAGLVSTVQASRSVLIQFMATYATRSVSEDRLFTFEVPHAPARARVVAMSSSILRSPVAITVDGELLLDVTELDVPADLDRLVEGARRQKGQVFVGVVLDPRETEALLHELKTILPNATGRSIAKRIRRTRRASPCR